MQDNYTGNAIEMQETTEELVVQYQNTNDEVYLEEIIRRNKGLIIKWANSYLNIPHSELEDLVAEAYIALLKAVKNFDIARGYNFTTCLKGYVLQHYNRLYYNATRIKRNNYSEMGSYEEMVDLHIDGSTAYEDDYSYFELTDYIQSLSDNQRAIVEFLINGYSKSEIARALNIKPASVTYHLKALCKSYTIYVGGVVA